MALPFALPGGSPRRQAGKAAPSLPFAPPSARNPGSFQKLQAAGVRHFNDEAEQERNTDMAAVQVARLNDQRAYQERQQREQRRSKRVAEQKAAAAASEKERQDALKVEVAKAEYGRALAPETMTETQRAKAEEDLAEKNRVLRSAASSNLRGDAMADPEYGGRTTGIPLVPSFIDPLSEPTQRAKDLESEADRLSMPEALTDADLENYRAKNPSAFAEIDKLRSTIDKDTAAREQRLAAERELATAKARAAGYDPGAEDITQPLSGFGAAAKVGEIDRDLAAIKQEERAIESHKAELGAMEQQKAAIIAKRQQGGSTADMAAWSDELNRLNRDYSDRQQAIEQGVSRIESARKAAIAKQESVRERMEAAKRPSADQPPESTVTIEDARRGALKSEDGAYETTQVGSLSALADAGERVYWKGATPVAPEERAAKAEQSKESIAILSETSKAIRDEGQKAYDRIMDRVRAGRMTEEQGEAEWQRALADNEKRFSESSGESEAILEDALRDFQEGRIDAGSLNAMFHAAGAAKTGIEAFKEVQARLKADEEHAMAIESAILGEDGSGAEDVTLNGEMLALSAELAKGIESQAFPIILPGGQFSNATPDQKAKAESDVQAGRAKNIAALRDRIEKARAEREAKLSKILTERGVDVGDHARLIAQAELSATEKARPGIGSMIASRGGLASALGEKLPFAGGLVEAVRILPYAVTASKMEAGEQVTEEELAALSEFVRFAGTDSTFIAKVTDGVSALPGFITELYTTAGIATAVKKAGTEGLKAALMRTVTKEGRARLAKASAAAIAKKAATDAPKRMLAGRIASGFVQEAARLPFASASRIVAGATREKATDAISLTPKEGKLVATIDASARKGTLHMVADAVVDSYIENLSERSGAYIAGAAGRMAPQAVKTALSKLGDATKGKLMSAAIVKSIFARNPDVPVNKIGRFLKTANVGGVLEEMGEERVGGLARDVWKGLSENEWGITVPSLEDFAVEFVTFLVPGGLNAVRTNRHFGSIDKAIRASDADSSSYIESMAMDPEVHAAKLSEALGEEITAKDIDNASALVGDFGQTDSIKALDRHQLRLMEESERAIADGNLDRGSRLRQMALGVSRQRNEAADAELVKAVGAAKDVQSIRERAQEVRDQASSIDPADVEALGRVKAQADIIDRSADMVAGIVKIAQGRDGVMTNAERTAVMEGDQPLVVDEGGDLIITDAGIAEVSKIAPEAASYVRQSETERREQLLSREQGQATLTPGASASPGAAQTDSGGTSPEAGASPAGVSGGGQAQGGTAATPAAVPPATTSTVAPSGTTPAGQQGQGSPTGSTTRESGTQSSGGVWTATGTNGTKVSIPASQAKTKAAAETELALKLPKGESLRAGTVTTPKMGQSEPQTSPTAEKPGQSETKAPFSGKAWAHETRKKVAKKTKDAKVQAETSRVLDSLGRMLDTRASWFPGGVTVSGKRGGGGISLNPSTKGIQINPVLVASQTGNLNDTALEDWLDRIIAEEGIHLASIEAISFKEAAEAWQKLGKSASGKKLQADTLRAYNAAYEARKENAPALADANAYFELLRMAIQNTDFRQRITEATFTDDPSVKDDLLNFLKRIAEWMAKRIASLPSGQRAAFEADLAKVRSAMDALGIKPEVPKAEESVAPADRQPSSTVKSTVKDGNPKGGKLIMVKLTDGQRIHINRKQWESGADPVRAFNAEGRPVRGDKGAIPRASIELTPVDEAANESAESPLNDTPAPSDKQKEAGNYKMGHIKVGGMEITVENPAGSTRTNVSVDVLRDLSESDDDAAAMAHVALLEEGPKEFLRHINYLAASGVKGLVANDAKPWAVTMQSHYGYLPGTKGKDGDHIDIFVAQGTPEDYEGPVFVVNQMRPVELESTSLATGRTSKVDAGMEFDEHKAVVGKGITSEDEARAEYVSNYSPGWDAFQSIAYFPTIKAFRDWASERRRTAPAKSITGKKELEYAAQIENSNPELAEAIRVRADVQAGYIDNLGGNLTAKYAKGTKKAKISDAVKKVVPDAPAKSDAYKEAQAKTKEALDGLFAAERPTTTVEQKPVEPERLGAIITAAKAVIEADIRTPEALAAFLDDTFTGGKARAYTEAIWDAMGMVDKALRGTHDWSAIYGGIDNPAEEDTSKIGFVERISEYTKDALLAGEPIRKSDRQSLLNPSERSTVTEKQIDEAIELGITIAAREIVQDGNSPAETYAKLVELYARQPTLGQKTSTSKINQAYSTPAPLAYVGSRIADIRGGKVIGEYTAGNGMLLIERKDGQTIIANEIDANRRRALLAQDIVATDRDATDFAPTERPDRLLMNPPFGQVMLDTGSNRVFQTPAGETTSIDHAIMLQALATMEPDGRAVFLIGGPPNTVKTDKGRREYYQRGKSASLHKYLHDNYRVIDHFTVSGDLYAKQGAGWPIDVIVIDGVGRSPISLPGVKPPRMIDSWEALSNELDRSDNERIKLTTLSESEVREQAQSMVNALDEIAGAGSLGGLADESGGRGNRRPEPAGEQRPNGGIPTARDEGGMAGPGRQDSVSPATSDERGQRGRSDEDRSNERPSGNAVGDREAGEPAEKRVDGSDFQAEYKPVSEGNSFGLLAPVNLAKPMRTALERLETRVGPIRAYVREKLGYGESEDIDSYYAAEQLDALAQAIYNVENGGALVVGDQTGVGKGRVVAGLMKYAVKRGLTPVFFTKDPTLYEAMLDDLIDVNAPEILPVITNNKFDDEYKDFGKRLKKAGIPYGKDIFEQFTKDGKMPDGVNAVFTSYSQISSDNDPSVTKRERAQAKANGEPVADWWRMAALRKLAPNSIFILDESHLASGQSSTGWRAASLLQMSPNVYYSSATFAKRPDNMALYFKTNMGQVASSMSELMGIMTKGGVPAMQVASSMLAEDGQYMRRERSFAGVKFETKITHENYERDKNLADAYTEGLRTIIDVQDAMVKASEAVNLMVAQAGKRWTVPPKNRARLESTNFSAQLHNLTRQYLLSIKARSAAEQAIMAINGDLPDATGKKRSQKVIVAVENTMEGAIKELSSKDFPLSFNGLLLMFLDKQRTFTIKGGSFGRELVQTTIPLEGDPKYKDVTGEQLQDRLVKSKINEEGEQVIDVDQDILKELITRAMSGVFKQARSQIEAMNLGDMPLSPIDAMKQAVERAGFQTGEMTARDTVITKEGKIEQRKDKSRQRDKDQFNNGNVHFLVINKSGSTGVSMHASEKFKDRRPRLMIVVQANLDINEFMQTLGRIFRSGQVELPSYMLLQTSLPVENRPAAILGMKMSMLNANTTSNADSDVSNNDAIDIFNKYGDEVVHGYLSRNRGLVNLINKSWSGKLTDKDGKLKPLRDFQNPENGGDFGYLARSVTGHLAILPVEEQEAFWEWTSQEYRALIDYLDQIGKNDLRAKTLDAKAKTISKRLFTEGADGESVFSASSWLETVEVKMGREPMSVDDAHEAAIEARKGNDTKVRDYLTAADRFITEEEQRKAARARKWEEKKEEWLGQQRQNRDTIANAIDSVGTFGTYERGDGTRGMAFIQSIKINDEKPLTPSAHRAKVILNESEYSLEVPLSKLRDFFQPQTVNTRGLWKETWDYGSTRSIVTGNLLAALAQLNGRGQIISYTLADGGSQMGVLLPASFTADQEKEASSRVPISTAADLRAVIEVQGNVMNSEETLRFVPTPSGGMAITAPASRTTGGRYWRNPALNALMVRSEFVQKGSKMVGEIPDSKVEDVLTLLQSQGESFVRTYRTFDSEGKLLSDASQDEEDISTARRPSLNRDRTNAMLAEAASTLRGENAPLAAIKAAYADLRAGSSTSWVELPALAKASGIERGPFMRAIKAEYEAGRAYLEPHNEPSKIVGEDRRYIMKDASGAPGFRVMFPDGDLGSAPRPGSDDRKYLEDVKSGFYSRLREAVNKANFGTTKPKPPSTWKGVIKKWSQGRTSAGGSLWREGIKQEELKWSGVLTWLDGQTAPLTKQQVLDYLDTEGKVTLEEVSSQDSFEGMIHIGDESVPFRRVKGQKAELLDAMYDHPEREDEILEAITSGIMSGKDWRAEGRPTDTKFAQYQLPGGENYREVVLAMPPKPEGNLVSREIGGMIRYRYEDENGSPISTYGTTPEEAQSGIRRENQYTSSHFSDIPNYVAHMRLNERTDAEGQPGLFIEELQSDRHQAGREKGYQYSSPEGWTATLKHNLGMGQKTWIVEDAEGKEVVSNMAGNTAEEAIGYAFARDKKMGAIPDAPHRKDWPLAMFKRALRDAVASGKEWIGWTVGITQVDRYTEALRQRVDRISWVETSSGKTVRAEKDGEVVFEGIVRDGKFTDGPAAGESVSETLGKEVADKISKDVAGDLKGDTLTVGGEGMKGFYDDILPKTVGKYVKQWGGKVETVSESEFQPLEFKTKKDAQRWLAKQQGGDLTIEATETGGFAIWDEVAGREVGAMESPAMWRVNITPAMRESITNTGQPLFSSRRLGIEDPDFAAALDEIERDLPTGMDLRNLHARAGLDWGREYSENQMRDIGENVRRGLRGAYDETLDRQTHEEWNDAAVDLIKNNRDQVLRDLVSTARDTQEIKNPVQVKAAQLLLPSLFVQGIANQDKQALRDAEAMVWAYDIAGTETARGLAARWKPHQTPEDAHREALAKMIFTPGHDDRKKVDRAPTPETKKRRIKLLEQEIERVKATAQADERETLAQAGEMTEELRSKLRDIRKQAAREIKRLKEELARVQAEKDKLQVLHETNEKRLKLIEDAFADMGVTFHDLFISKEAIITLRGSSMVKTSLANLNETERKAIKLRLEGRSDRAISKKAGISVKSVSDLNGRFDSKLKEAIGSWVDRGFSLSDFEMTDSTGSRIDISKLIDKDGNLLSASRPTLTPEERQSRIEEIFKAIVPPDKARNTGALKRKTAGNDPDQYGFDISRPEHAVVLMRAIARLDSNPMDMVYEYWINGLLSGAATHVANIAGNTGNAAFEYMIQRPAEAITNAILFRDAAGASLSEYRSMAKYATTAAATAWTFAKIAWSTEVSLFDSQWLNKPISIRGASGDKGQVQRFAIKGTKGRIIRMPSRALQFADEWAKHFLGMIEASAQAHRIAKAEELEGEAFDKRVASLVRVPGSSAWIAAVDKAHSITFTNQLPKTLHKMTESLHERADTAWGTIIKTMFRFIFPFVRTPYNIFATGIRKTPLGGIRMTWKGGAGLVDAWKGNQPFFDSYPKAAIAYDLAEQIIGWGAALAITAMAEGDPDDDKKIILITGTRSMGDNRGEDQLLSRLKGGETTILYRGKPLLHYGRYEPFATVIATVVDAMRAMKAVQGGVRTSEAANTAFWNLVDQARSKTFLQGFDGLMSLLDGHKSMTDAAAKFVLKGLVPNLIRQPIRNIDEYVRDSRSAPWYYNAIPLGGLAEPLYDIYGRPMERGGNAAARVFISTPNEQLDPHPVDVSLDKFGRTNPLERWYPRNPTNRMFRYQTPSGEWVDMTPAEIAEYRREAGREFDLKSRSILPSPTVPSIEQVEDLDRVKDRAYSSTKKRMFEGGIPPPTPKRRSPTLADLFGMNKLQ